MNLRANAHCHSIYCDGKSPPEDMIRYALKRNFLSLGFSIHGWTPYELVPVTLEKEAAYRAELCRLRGLYGQRLEILIGAERDALYPRDFSAYEYLIDSTHWFIQEGVYICVDDSEEKMVENVRAHFGGDYYAYCRGYYRQVAAVCARSDAAFIGHIDLVGKFNEGNRYFDESDARYLKPALEALDCALEKHLPIEMNTGAISRGLKRQPYPAPPLLAHIRARGGEILINSDAHSARHLDFGFEKCVQLTRACGFDHVLRLRRSGFEAVPLTDGGPA